MNINVCFVKESKPVNLQVTDDMMFAEIAFKYFSKMGIDQNTDQPKFLFNSKEIRNDCYKTLRELGIKNMARIDVVIGKDVIGAFL